jgi:hypothetical protein
MYRCAREKLQLTVLPERHPHSRCPARTHYAVALNGKQDNDLKRWFIARFVRRIGRQSPVQVFEA